MRSQVSRALFALHLSVVPPLAAQLPNSIAAERARLFEITRDSFLQVVPSDSARGARSIFFREMVDMSGLRVRLLPPEIRSTWNSAIPYTLNDGPLWAGVGHSLSASGGVQAERVTPVGVVTVRVAPMLLFSENRPFQVRPETTSGRSAFASPFHRQPYSADLPQRFGDRHLVQFDPGRTALTIRSGAVSAGVTAESEVWGPGIRNQILMSANAPGIPRFFVGTARPARTRFGAIRAKLISGALSESVFFDDSASNDVRSISGVLVDFVPAFDSTLMVGAARVVYRPVTGSTVGSVLANSLSPILHWEYLLAPGDTSARQHADQIASVFARWIAPEVGLEVYGEWARMELPRSPTELLTAGHHTLGYTVGAQWAHRRDGHRYLRVQAEFTNLEQSIVFPGRPPADFYSGRATSQGYTNRGQIIGAGVGPGGSSQWLAVDYIAPRWQAGWYLGRQRWENDAMYREPIPTLFNHDVTVLSGIRGGRRTRWSDVSADATFGYRFNYLFQNGFAQPSGFSFRTVDVRNFTLSVALTPR